MKKKNTTYIILACVILLVLFISVVLIYTMGVMIGLFPSRPLKNHMDDYYGNDGNYQTLTGEIKEIYGDLITVNITSKNGVFYDAPHVFLIHSPKSLNLKVGDTITFTSAPMLFYNGDHYPIVSLERNGEVMLESADGKAALFDHINRVSGFAD